MILGMVNFFFFYPITSVSTQFHQQWVEPFIYILSLLQVDLTAVKTKTSASFVSLLFFSYCVKHSPPAQWLMHSGCCAEAVGEMLKASTRGRWIKAATEDAAKTKKKESHHFIFPGPRSQESWGLSCMSGAPVFNHRGDALRIFLQPQTNPPASCPTGCWVSQWIGY